MGRPPIGKAAMSGAERQQRYMAKLLAGAKPSVTKPVKPAGSAPPPTRRGEDRPPEFGGEIGKLQGEIGALKSDIFKLKAMLREDPDAAKLRKKVVDQTAEINKLRGKLKEIAKERDRYQARTQPKYRNASELLTRQNHDVLIKALHPDRSKHVTAAELAEAERVAIALRPLFVE